MAVLADWTPLRAESIDTIRARIDAGTNAGLDPADPRWTDTTPAGFFWDHTQTFALEGELLWDMASVELPASFFLPFSWGIYLDYWGELLSVLRKDEVHATGIVTFTNQTGQPITVGSGTEVAAPANDPDSDPLSFTTAEAATVAVNGTADLPVVAAEGGTEYNVAADAISLVLSPLVGLTVTNADPITTGADVEGDDAYKQRLLLEFSAARGGGTRDDYVAEALAQPGVGHVVVEPRWAGNGTVRLIVTTASNDPMSTTAIAAIQQYFDPAPEAGNGVGAAPINHVVTVATVSAVVVAIAATIELEAGFTLTDDGVNENITQALTDAIDAYFATLLPGDDVQHNRVLAAMMDVTGVHDVTSLSLAGSTTADTAIATLEVARPGTPTFTAA